jgi:hypothetical protein
MAVTFLESFPEIILARQPYWQELQTDEYIVTAGVRWQTHALLSINPVDGETLIVAAGTYNITFTFKTFGTATDPYHIELPPSPTLYATILRNNMLAAFQRSWQIMEYWDCPYDEALPNFNIRAKQPGNVWAIIFSGTSITNGRFDMLSNNVAGVNEVRLQDFRFYYDLWIYDNAADLYPSIKTGFSLVPDNNQRARFRYERLVHDVLAPDVLPYVQTDINNGIPALHSVARVQFRATEVAAELITEPDEPTGWNPPAYLISADIPAILAGRSRDTLFGKLTNRYAYIQTNFTEFFSLPTDRLYIAAWFAKPGASYTATVHCTVYYNDGTTASANTTATGLSGANQIGFNYIPINHTEIAALFSPTSKVILKYEVWLVSTDGSLITTPKITVHVQHDVPAIWHRIYIHNSRNGWDFIPAAGYMKRMIEGESVLTEVDENEDLFYNPSNSFQGTLRTTDSSHSRIYEVNTGYRPKAWIETLAEELKECRRATYVPTGHTIALDIIIDQGSISEVSDELNQLHSLSFRFSLAWEDRAR